MTKKQQILDLHSLGHSVLEIASILNWKYNSVRSELNKEGLVSHRTRNRNVQMNTSYFSIIDDEYKAYFLGFLHADGGLYTTKKDVLTLSFGLASEDRYIIEKLLFLLNSTQKISDRVINSKNFSSISFGNKDFVNTLTDLKSPDLYKRVPLTLLSHFIRGYFDGNGCITYKGQGPIRSKIWRYDIVGPNEIIHSIYQLIPHFFNPPTQDSKHPSMSRMRKSTSQVVLDFHKYLYQDATIYLRRKKDKFDNAVLVIKSSTTKQGTSPQG